MKTKYLFYLLISLFVVSSLSCKEEEILPEPPDGGEFYFVTSINEKSKHLVSGRNGYRMHVETSENASTTDPDIKNIKYKSGMAQLNNNYYIKSSEAAYVYFDNNWFNNVDYAADPNFFFSSVFSEGTRVFCNMSDEVTPCVEIFWKDTYAKEWSTRYGAQDAGTFTITSVTESIGSSGENQRLVRASFEGKLYNNIGESMVLKNGQLFLIFKRV